MNLAYGKLAVQISLYISPAAAAVDGDLTTASCTGDEASAWWAVDLGQTYQISHVDITSPNLDGYRNYTTLLPTQFTSPTVRLPMWWR